MSNKYFFIAAKYNKSLLEHVSSLVDVDFVEDINQATCIVYPVGATLLSVPLKYASIPRMTTADLVLEHTKKEEMDVNQVDEIKKMLGSSNKESFMLGCKMYYKIPLDKIKMITTEALSSSNDIKSLDDYNFIVEEISHVCNKKA